MIENFIQEESLKTGQKELWWSPEKHAADTQQGGEALGWREDRAGRGAAAPSK